MEKIDYTGKSGFRVIDSDSCVGEIILFSVETEKKVQRVFTCADEKIINPDYVNYVYFPPMYYINRGFFDQNLVNCLENGGNLLVVGSGEAMLAKLLWQGFSVDPKQITVSDKKLPSVVKSLPFQQCEFDMTEDWPEFSGEFDYILFPESFGVAFDMGAYDISNKFFEDTSDVVELIVQGQYVDPEKIEFYKNVLGSECPVFLRKVKTLMSALEAPSSEGEIRFDYNNWYAQELVFFFLKLRESYPNLTLVLNCGFVTLRK